MDLIQQVVQRYTKLGLLAQGTMKDGTKHDVLLHPMTLPSSDIGVGGLRDVPARGVKVWLDGDESEDEPTQTVSGGVVRFPDGRECESRLDELLALAANQGIVVKDVEGFEDRVLTFTASDETRDRYGDRILVDGSLDGKKYGKGWQTGNFRRNPVFMPFHSYDQFPLGTALDTWTDVKGKRKRLRMSVLFDDGTANPASPQFLAAYRNKLIRCVSVGFWPLKAYSPTDDEERKKLDLGPWGILFGEQDLWENSAVSIPANPNAMQEDIGDLAFGRGLEAQYERLADEVADVAPAFAYMVRDAMASGRKYNLGALQEVKGPAEGVDTPAAAVAASPSEQPSLAPAGADVSSLEAKVERLTAAVEELAVRVGTLHQQSASPAAPVKARSEDHDGPDPYEKLLSSTNQLAAAVARQE